ncbi:YkvA family protein, partial [Veillonella sp.]
LGYLVLPIDIVPDTIPVLGWIDDVAVLGLAFKVANRYIKTRHQEEAKKYFPFGGSN